MKKLFSGFRPLKPLELIGAAFLAFILLTGAIYVHKAYKQEKTLFGKEVIYSNHFYHAQEVSSLPGGRALFGECVKTRAQLKVTEDTTIFTGEKGSIGYKPLYVDDMAGLHCIRKDGVEVIFVRLRKDSTITNIEDEDLLMVQPEGNLLLTNKKGCYAHD